MSFNQTFTEIIHRPHLLITRKKFLNFLKLLLLLCENIFVNFLKLYRKIVFKQTQKRILMQI